MWQRFNFLCGAILPLGLLLFVVGCGGNPNLGDVRGVVTLDGEPLPNAFVQFTPDSGGASSYGRTNETGSYRMKFTDSEMGSFIGASRVSIKTGDIKRDNSGTVPELVPRSYNAKTTLTADVKSGSNIFDWDLKSDAGKIVQPRAN